MAVSEMQKPLDSSINRLESTKFNDSIDIERYNSSSNVYTFPTDGYVLICSESSTNGLYDVSVLPSDVQSVFARLAGRFSDINQYQSIYVRKGMRTYVSDRSSPVTVRFRSIKE